MKSITDIGERYGRILYAAILSTGLFTTGILTDNKKIENTGRILFEGLLIAGVTAEITKIAAGRSRPFTNEPSSTFNFFKTDNPHNSFPSGHTVVAFTTSSVLAASIKNVYISIALYSLAGLTAYQRIYSDNHWFSDTILSAVLGTTVGNMLVLINDERSNEPLDQKVNFNFAPALFPEGLGINVMITF